MSTPTQRLSRLRRLAYKQAGHAVLCIIHRRRLNSVSISMDGNYKGKLELGPLTLFDERTGRPDRTKAEREIIIDLGGPVAERLAGRHREWRGTGRHVLRAALAINLASQISSRHETARAFLKYQWLQTRDTLEQSGHWSAVQAVAAELIDRGRVSGYRVRQLYRKAASKR